MEDVPIDQAKLQLDDLVHRAQRGEDVRIATSDGLVVRLQPLQNSPEQGQKRIAGRLKGKFEVPDGLLEPLPADELRRWNESDD